MCYKYNKVGYLAKNCRLEQKIKNRSIQKDSENKKKEENVREMGFVEGLEQAYVTFQSIPTYR